MLEIVLQVIGIENVSRVDIFEFIKNWRGRWEGEDIQIFIKDQSHEVILANWYTIGMKTILVDAVDAFVIEKEGSFSIFKEMHDLLETFPNRKILLTGANDEQFKTFGLDSMPYEVFTLKHNPEKTDPQYFKTLFEEYGLTADGVVYFEHNPEAVKSAESVGIRTFYYDSEKRDLEALKSFLTTNL